MSPQRRGAPEQTLRRFVRWLYREREIGFHLRDCNHDDLGEREALALVDWFLDPEKAEAEIQALMGALS